MERLTNENHKEIGFVAYDGPQNPFDVCLTIGELAGFVQVKYSPRAILEEVFAHLAAYEDTGLTPDEIIAMKNAFMGREIAKITEFAGVPIDRMCELARAEKEGRLAVLPSKPDYPAYIVHCRDCKYRYPKDFEAFCPHRVGPCKPDGFCDRGERRDT